MKILAIVSTLDLRYGLGCTPVWWQLLKGLYEAENEILAIPYLGKEIETIWWKTSKNPCQSLSDYYFSLSRVFFPRGAGIRPPERLTSILTEIVTKRVWLKYLKRVIRDKGPFDCLIFFNVPLNQINGIATDIKKDFNLKIVYYDGDMPSIFPETNKERGFIFNYYKGASLNGYDLILVNSEGSVAKLKEMGAQMVKPLHYAADPELFHPIVTEKVWDVAFFGFGSKSREYWMTKMITEASIKLSRKFVIGGEGFRISLGNAHVQGIIPTSQLRRFCSSSWINLNITASTHSQVFGSSTARPFELAAMGCCIVSCPYKGLERWFEPGKEIIILSNEDDVADIYENLLSDREKMISIGKAARKRIIKDHTYKIRAKQMMTYIQNC